MGLLDNIDEPTMAMAMGLLGSGGYSRMPVSTGQGMAAGFGAFQEAKRAQQEMAMRQADAGMRRDMFDLNKQQHQMQLDQMQRAQADRDTAKANLQAYVSAMPDGPQKQQIIQAVQMGVPMKDVWDRLNPKQEPYSLGPGHVRFGADNTPVANVPIERKAPEGMQFGADGSLVAIPGYVAMRKEIAAAGRPMATTNVFNNTKDNFKNERDLRNDFSGLPTTKAFNEVRAAYDQISTSLKSASPAGDLAAATKFMKILDPGSVVRESELGMAMAATGALDRVTNYAQMMISGQKLTQSQRQDFGDLARKLYEAAEGRYNASANEYRTTATDYGLNPDRVAKVEKNIKAVQSSGMPPIGRSSVISPGGWSASVIEK